jgi:hypothetical protein
MLPYPLTIDKRPPVLNEDVPDDKISSPPEPLLPDPTLTYTEPPRPLEDTPLPIYNAPLLPLLDVPLLSNK